MGSRIVFLHYHGIGHLNPCFPLARILQKHQYEVYFAGVEYFKGYVEAEGFSFYPLRSVPFGLGFETWINTIEKKKYLYWSTLWARITDRLYVRREHDLLTMVRDLAPNVILFDGTQATDFIVLYPHLKASPIRVGVLHAMLPTQVVTGRPPVNSDAFPEDINGFTEAVQAMKLKQRRKSWVQKMKFLFFDDHYIIDRRIRKNKLPDRYRSDALTLFYYNIKSVPEFVLVAREFDFPDFEVDPDQHYIGFMMNPTSHELFDNGYLRVREEIKSRKHRENAKVLYCSFGTIESDHRETILNFLNKLVRIAAQEKFLLIISLGTEPHQFDQLQQSERVYCFKSVPQIDVLTFADVFITHGGLSSIKESIHALVPMLMYPVHTDFDPVGNAARIAYHGFGERGNAHQDPEQVIRRKIIDLISDHRYIQNLRALKTKNERYTELNFLKLFELLQPIVVTGHTASASQTPKH